MAKVFRRKANKDYPQNGIKKGDIYYFAQIKTGPRSSHTIRSLTYPSRSQLTSSGFLQTAYELSDRVQDATSVEELEEIKGELENLQSDTQNSLDNMPQGLQEGDTGQLLQERIEQIDNLMQEIDSVISDVEDADQDAEGYSDLFAESISSNISSGF